MAQVAAQTVAQANPANTTSATASTAQAEDPVVARYAGSYRRGSVDSAEQLVLLPDKTYCFSVMAGSLDLFSGGRWQAAAGGSIALQEVKPTKPIFPAFMLKNPEQSGQKNLSGQKDLSGQVVFNFHGRSMSRANEPVFAVSSTAELPSKMQRLFPADHNGWDSSYTLPPMPATQAQYFYIGHWQRDAKKSPPRLQITQYKLGDANTVQIGFDRIQAMPLMAFNAQLAKVDDEDILQLDNRRFGRKSEISQKLMEDARTHCITPALFPDTVPMRPRRDGSTVAAPLQNFDLKLDAVQAEPWFDMKTKE